MATEPLKLILVAGARPNFMKVAPLIHAIHRHNASLVGDSTLALGSSSDYQPSTIHHQPDNGLGHLTSGSGPSTLNPQPSTATSPSPLSNDSQHSTLNSQQPIHFSLVHTGQHYDANMSDVFFKELGIPKPDYHLEVGSGSHAVQTANVMIRFEPICEQVRPDWVVVCGDVNSTVACALVAVKMGIKVAHVEAGLRSRDRAMPEEINRIVTDSISDLLLTPSADGDENLKQEGIPESKIRMVGNIMIDSLIAHQKQAEEAPILQRLGLEPGKFIYVTLHRPSNVDREESLGIISRELAGLAERWPVVFPMHPRTRKRLSDFGCPLEGKQGIRIVEPVGYYDSLALTKSARLVLTDSGGLQEESTYFRTPCLTLRPNTERPITVTVGSNRLTNVEDLSRDLEELLAGPARRGNVPPLWDGATATRVLDCLLEAQQ
jgi:UDP-N-acetylglucosamine 2-epimerase (non-hydrolysing)